MKAVKNVKLIVGVGLANYLIRFAVAGVLLRGVGVDPTGVAFGALVTIVALLAAYVLLKFVMKPASRADAFRIALVWVVIALILDAITGVTLLKLPLGYYFSEWQTWTRLIVILLVAPFAVRKPPSVSG